MNNLAIITDARTAQVIGCVTVMSIVLKFADKIDAMGEKPTTCEVWLHAKPLETHVWKGELK